jgi:hypothetical protein
LLGGLPGSRHPDPVAKSAAVANSGACDDFGNAMSRHYRSFPIAYGPASLRRGALALLALALTPFAAQAQTDEIQVYDATIEPPGESSLTIHDNYTPIGRTTPAFPNGLVPNHTENGVLEWALGVKPWWELGLYFPLYSFTDDGKILYNGFKLRSLFVSPHARDRRFFYGLNFEFSVNTKHWDPSHYSGEIRPIAGMHLGLWDLIINPILDTEFSGLRRLGFAPAERVAYNLTPTWALAAEHYGDYGMVSGLEPIGHGSNAIFGVVDYSGQPAAVEFGIGHGFSGQADKLVLKLVLARAF